MSFDTIQFKYTPPLTVSSVSSTGTTSEPVSLVTGVSSSNTAASSSAAGKLIDRLSNLLDTNQFLQQVILARSAKLGVTFDAASDPETARALQTIYGDQSVPTVLPISMYNSLLDAEVTAMQIGAALGNGSDLEVNGFQTAAVSQVNQTIESSLVNSGQFQSQLSLLLRPLKGDAAVINNMAAQLAQYPVIASSKVSSITSSDSDVISMAGQDVSSTLATTLNDNADSLQSSYASIYQLSAGVGVVAQDVNNILNAYVAEPATNIIRMIAMFQALQGFVHATRLKTVVGSLTGLVFVQLMTEASAMEMMLDRFYQTAVTPLRSAESSIVSMVHQIEAADMEISQVAQGIKQTFVNQTGALKGCSMAYNCGLPHNANAKKPNAPGLTSMSNGMKAMVSHLDWALNAIPKKIVQFEESFKKLLNRRTADMNAQLDLMCSMQALNTMLDMAKAVKSFKSAQSAVGASSSVMPTAAAGQILSGMSSTTGNTFVVTNGQVQAVAPTVPTPSSNVQTTLNAGGLNLIVASSST